MGVAKEIHFVENYYSFSEKRNGSKTEIEEEEKNISYQFFFYSVYEHAPKNYVK